MTKALAPIIFFVIAIGLFFSYTKPAYDVLLAFQAQEKELDEAIDRSKELLNRYDALKAKYVSIERIDKLNLSKILPEELDVVRLILDVDALASKNKIKINSFNVPDIEKSTKITQKTRASSAQAENPVKSAVVTIECEGEYQDLKAMLFEIERSLSLMDVVALEVKVPDMTRPGTTEGIVYTIGLQSYWLKQ